MNERERLLKRVQMYSFAIVDAALFLDTHPNDASGLAYYKKYKNLYKEAVEEFESKYGPLTILSDRNDTCWQWVNDPWPWEEQTEEVR
ncbi:MAG: spore coat protein CotJB [Oscillospiraceae bacterium]|nr:spore coat protein CotJB [Oscillospiraceae bacterium]